MTFSSMSKSFKFGRLTSFEQVSKGGGGGGREFQDGKVSQYHRDLTIQV